ncbi:hypothetical protein [Mycobacteroides abscessus]|uniref:hypothetical protein n=1 Tax=Mycobacteroides abscessus TaxID=36809 RepID=UPI000C2630B0|nr:hypothetical protein [Mycobacteroides abscessus]
MGFTVHRPDGKDEFGDTSSYRFGADGLLTVTVCDAEGIATLVRTFSPHGWLEVTADKDHGQGSPKGGNTAIPRRLR